MAVVIGVGIVTILAGIVLVWVAVAGWRGRLSRGLPIGVRTPSTMRSDEAFAVANKAAAPLGAAGGGVVALGGVLANGCPETPVRRSVVLRCPGRARAVTGRRGRRSPGVQVTAHPDAVPQ